MPPLLDAWNNIPAPVIGMLHALPLPGAPAFSGEIAEIEQSLLRDAEALAGGGVHGLMLENFGDAPFYPRRVPALTVAHLTRLALAVRQRFDLPLGINVLRNDGLSALAIASAVGAAFIRVNIFCGARVTDQGVIQGIAHQLMRRRAVLGVTHIRIFADASVKHSAPLGPPRPLEDEIADMVQRGGADAVVVSGAGTGKATALEDVIRARAAAEGRPVLIGSGITSASIAQYRGHANGFIVGSSLKPNGDARQPVDAARVRELMQALAG